MAANALDRIKSAASGAVVIGTAVAARAARTAGPLVGRVIGAVKSVKSRVGDSPRQPAGTDPVTVTPPPAEPGPGTTIKPSPATPSPAAVAKNIPPHPPAPKKKPVKKAVPGAKLPPPRKASGS